MCAVEGVLMGLEGLVGGVGGRVVAGCWWEGAVGTCVYVIRSGDL